MNKNIKEFYKKEIKKPTNLINPIFLFKLLLKLRYLHFFAVGVTGVLINLSVTWFFTKFVFGLENYYLAYIIGLSCNLIFNYSAHILITFKVKTKRVKRFFSFVGVSLLVTALQMIIVKVVTPIVGLKYYLIVIAITILTLSIISFITFKLVVFKEKE